MTSVLIQFLTSIGGSPYLAGERHLEKRRQPDLHGKLAGAMPTFPDGNHVV
jgi:hypothetical protein